MINLYGITIFKNPSMVIQHNEIVKRSWKERLFFLPWRPWVKIRVVVHYDPDPNLYTATNKMGMIDTIWGHPATLAKLIQTLEITDWLNGLRH
jgi:hypothetical protein